MSLCRIIWIIIMHDNVLTPQYELFWRDGIRSLSLGAWKQMPALCLLTFSPWSTGLNLHYSVHSARNIICELFSKQTKSGSSVNSLKLSGAEMSLSTSNIRWQWCRNIGQLRSNCISEAFPNESMAPRITWNTLERHSQLSICVLCSQMSAHFSVFFSAVAAGSRSSECAESSLVQYIYHQVIQQNEKLKSV